MPDESKLVQSVGNWPRVSGGNDDAELEWVELRPGVKVLQRKKVKMEPPPQNKMRRKGVDK